MADPNSPSTPAADVRQALFVDIEQFLKHDKSPPRTIREVAAGDDFLSALAQSLIDAVGGCAAIDELHGRPHIDHDFDWAGISLDDRPRVEELPHLTTAEHVFRWGSARASPTSRSWASASLTHED